MSSGTYGFFREREGGGQGSSLSYNTINLINTYLK